MTSVTAVASLASAVLVPRLSYSDPEVTVGWKARWHVSALAPVMTQVALTMLNEYKLKDAFKEPRPGCPDEDGTGPDCADFGMMSSHTYAAFSALGHGAAVFIFDTAKHSGGRFHGGAFAGEIVTPLVLGLITGIGRGVGDWETGGQVLAGGAAGLGLGFLTGMTYALMQRPMCGYSGALVCW
ncbi:MAG: hypothetical protein JW751_16570 [Polyangiaceae bacterium]|nr:hypothetical protein [Polyangiaceae bacterium]